MEQAGARIAEAEESALEHQRKAIRDHSTAHRSAIYPPGAEYALCHAEAQLMSAVIAVLNESLTESLRGFYKLRKAFSTLYEINEAEKSYLRKHGNAVRQSQSFDTSRESIASSDQPTNGAGAAAQSSGKLTPSTTDDSEDEDDGYDFVDAKDKTLDAITPIGYQGHLEYPDMNGLDLKETITEKFGANNNLSPSPPATGVDVDSNSAAAEADNEVDIRTITTDPIDLFIHSGTGLCFGLLQLMLSMIPPAFGRLLSLFSFRGDREAGLRMLWSATKFKTNINGAMAGLITLGFHNGAIAFCDILSSDALPEARLRNLLQEMRSLYPKSKLWLLEEARMLSRDRRLEDAIDIVAKGPKSSLKQVEALAIFERSLSLMYLHRYQECADSFLECVGLNNWSHALYYYIAGACYVELYRTNKASNPEKAKEYASSAEKHLHEVPQHAGKKRFMARQLPFDVFVSRKIIKWEARAKARNCSFVDAIGISPVVEMSYFWSGMRRMNPEHLQLSLERLAWSEDELENPQWKSEPSDEQAILSLLRASCQRFLGQTNDAQKTLTNDLFSHDLHQLKACEHPDTWPLPTGHYEMAVCFWEEAGGEAGDKNLLRKCSAELTKVENWESYDLDARIGMKVRTARETLKRTSL